MEFVRVNWGWWTRGLFARYRGVNMASEVLHLEGKSDGGAATREWAGVRFAAAQPGRVVEQFKASLGDRGGAGLRGESVRGDGAAVVQVDPRGAGARDESPRPAEGGEVARAKPLGPDECRARALKLVDAPTLWQRVLHGGAYELRKEVVGVLAGERGYKTAYRYACCGLGDQLTQKGDEVFVSPKGCGHKLCPRCGRRRGGKYAKRIIGWLAEKPHGDLWQMVLTQRVVKGETLKAARARMAPKQRAYMRWLTRRGLIGAMTCVHIVWSTRADGWHYHVHILVELPAGRMTKGELLDQWKSEGEDGEHRIGEDQSRMVVSAGVAIGELKEDSGDPDFWSESKSGIAKSVQYPLRDLVQGIAAWRLGGDAEKMRACATELVRDASGWKCFRAWGVWRKPVVVDEVVEENKEGGDDASAAPGPGPAPLGTVARCWRAARAGHAGMRAAFQSLEKSVRNDSEFAKRVVRYCRLACPLLFAT